MHAYRTHTCGDLREADVDKTARLSGWVHNKRDHGGVLFVDLRDHYGITHVMAHPDSPVYGVIAQVRNQRARRLDGQGNT